MTISQTQVHAFGWSGTGYMVLDPESGVGGYLIGGGADGGFTNGVIVGSVFALLATTIDFAISPKNAKYLEVTGELVAILAVFLSAFILGTIIIAKIQGWSDKEWGCFFTGFFTAFGLTSATLGKLAGNLTIIEVIIITLLGTNMGWKGSLPSPDSCLNGG